MSMRSATVIRTGWQHCAGTRERCKVAGLYIFQELSVKGLV